MTLRLGPFTRVRNLAQVTEDLFPRRNQAVAVRLRPVPPRNRVLNLDSPRAKLARAEAHFKELRSELEPFGQSKPITLRSQHNLRGTEQPIRMRYFVAALRPIPDHWSLVVGDLIHNLRCAVDHTVWALLLSQKGAQFVNRNRLKINFPIYDKPEGFAGHFVTQHVDTVARAILKHHQAYVRQSVNPRLDGLSALRELSNVDKHRSLHVVAYVRQESLVHTDPPLKDGEVTFVERGALYPGAEVVNFTATRPLPYCKVQVSAQIAAEVRVETPQGVGVPLDLGVAEMIARVQQVVADLG